MKTSQKNLIKTLPIFSGCNGDLIEKLIIGNGETRVFKSGAQMLLFDKDHPPMLGVLLSGRAVIYSSDLDKLTLLRFVSPGEIVGIAGLFAPQPPKTRVMACGDGESSMFFISRKNIEVLLDSENDGALRGNLLQFLSERVTFLNTRIDCVTGGSADRRLALFIKTSPGFHTGRIRIGMSMTALAHALDIGRASLYRAFDTLEHCGAIKRENDTIVVLDPNLLYENC